jgi:trimeric autotransporter adhesin
MTATPPPPPHLAITAGLVAGEQLGVTGTASFNSKAVLTANVVTVDSISLADGTGLASNYSLSAGQTTAAFITPAPLTASVTAPNKVYDGTSTATPSLSITAGLVGAEQISLSGTASFNSQRMC